MLSSIIIKYIFKWSGETLTENIRVSLSFETISISLLRQRAPLGFQSGLLVEIPEGEITLVITIWCAWYEFPFVPRMTITVHIASIEMAQSSGFKVRY